MGFPPSKDQHRFVPRFSKLRAKHSPAPPARQARSTTRCPVAWRNSQAAGPIFSLGSGASPLGSFRPTTRTVLWVEALQWRRRRRQPWRWRWLPEGPRQLLVAAAAATAGG
ncbi:unnamed protein product [Ectocarpus sp. 12 AP-2014]